MNVHSQMLFLLLKKIVLNEKYYSAFHKNWKVKVITGEKIKPFEFSIYNNEMIVQSKKQAHLVTYNLAVLSSTKLQHITYFSHPSAFKKRFHSSQISEIILASTGEDCRSRNDWFSCCLFDLLCPPLFSEILKLALFSEMRQSFFFVFVLPLTPFYQATWCSGGV